MHDNQSIQNDNGIDDKHDNFFHYDDGMYECKKANCNVTQFRHPDGTLKLRNPNISYLKEDVLYHLALGSHSHDLAGMFGDVQFVCMGGTSARMETLANYLVKELNYEALVGETLENIIPKSQRFAMYKVGPVLCVSHGMGVPSIGILLNEIIKLMYHARVKDPIFFRIGTCGGIGLEPGTVVVADRAVDEMGNNYHQYKICGKFVRRPAILDKRLVAELIGLSNPDDPFRVERGTTMCADDFYEGQGRTDGPFCDYTEEDKESYLKELQQRGVKNIEMEATVFAAVTHHAGIKAALVSVALIDRLKGDQVTTPKEVLLQWQNNPQVIVGRYIKQKLFSRK